MFQLIACYLRETRDIKANTIDQYVTHMVTQLRQNDWIFVESIRSPRLRLMLNGWHRVDILHDPLRTTSHIPATCPVMAVFFPTAREHHKNNPLIAAEICASAAIQYYIALRPTEASAATVDNYYIQTVL